MNTARISVSDGRGRQVADLDIKHMAGFPAMGRFGIHLNLEFRVREDGTDPAWFDEVAIDVRVNNQFFARFLPRPGQPRITTAWGALGAQMTFETIVDLRQLNALERVRQGRDLTVQLSYAGTTSTASSQRYAFSQTSQMVLTQSDWTRVLTEASFGRTVLLELPLEGVGDGRSKAAEHLAMAQAKLQADDVPEILRECRIVLDVLRDSMPARAEGDSRTDRQKRSKEQRLRALYDELHSFCSPATHGDSNAQSITHTRADAVLALATAAGLIQALPPMSAASATSQLAAAVALN